MKADTVPLLSQWRHQAASLETKALQVAARDEDAANRPPGPMTESSPINKSSSENLSIKEV